MPRISLLPPAGTLTGAELVPVVQGGVTSRTTATLIATLAAAFNSTIIVTVGGAVIVLAGTTRVIINKAAPSVTPVTLPTLAARGGLALLVFDFAGNGGDITVTPAAGEKINGLAANAPWVIGSGGAGLNGGAWFVPTVGVGWIAIA